MQRRSLSRFFNFKPSSKIPWFMLRVYYGSQIPVTIGGFELQTFYIQCNLKSFLTLNQSNLWSIVNIEHGIIGREFYSYMKLRTFLIILKIIHFLVNAVRTGSKEQMVYLWFIWYISIIGMIDMYRGENIISKNIIKSCVL